MTCRGSDCKIVLYSCCVNIFFINVHFRMFGFEPVLIRLENHWATPLSLSWYIPLSASYQYLLFNKFGNVSSGGMWGLHSWTKQYLISGIFKRWPYSTYSLQLKGTVSRVFRPFLFRSKSLPMILPLWTGRNDFAKNFNSTKILANFAY